MRNSAMRDALSLYYALYDYLVNLPELTKAQSAMKAKLEADQGISCDDSLDTQVLAYQKELNTLTTDEDRATLFEKVITLLS